MLVAACCLCSLQVIAEEQQNACRAGILVQPTRDSGTLVVPGYLYSLQGTAQRLLWRATCTAYKGQRNACRAGILVQPTRDSGTLGVAGYLYSLQGTAQRLSWLVTCIAYKEQLNACVLSRNLPLALLAE